MVPAKPALDNFSNLSKLQHEYAVNAWRDWVRWRNAQPNMETPKFGCRSQFALYPTYYPQKKVPQCKTIIHNSGLTCLTSYIYFWTICIQRDLNHKLYHCLHHALLVKLHNLQHAILHSAYYDNKGGPVEVLHG